jgi:hypothetical protein
MHAVSGKIASENARWRRQEQTFPRERLGSNSGRLSSRVFWKGRPPFARDRLLSLRELGIPRLVRLAGSQRQRVGPKVRDCGLLCRSRPPR